MNYDPILTAFNSLKLQRPLDEHLCIYKSGLVDSADLMQLLLEIELETEQRIDLSALIEGDVSLFRLRALVGRAK